MYLTPFDFVIKHRPGKTNPADGLSRQTNPILGDARGGEMLLPIRNRMVSDSVRVQSFAGLCATVQGLVEAKQFDVTAEPFPVYTGQDPIDRPDAAEVNDPIDRPDAAEVNDPIDRPDAAEVNDPIDRPDAAEVNDPIDRPDAAEVNDSDCESEPVSEEYWRGANWAALESLARDQRIPTVSVRSACRAEQVYSADANIDLRQLILRIQNDDEECRKLKGSVGKTAPKSWTIDREGALRFKGRLYIPAGENLRRQLMGLYHEDPLAGHFGRNRTETLLKRKFHWVNMHEDVGDFVASCAVCQRMATPRHRPYGKLESLPVPKRPWSEITMDFVTGLPETIYKGQFVDAIFVVVDRYTKMSRFFPVSTQITAAELAELFHSEIELKYGPPDGIVSDRGPIFTSKFWGELCYLSRVKLRLSTAFHAQTDGQTERMNQTLEQYLRCFIDDEQLLWPKLLLTAEFCCNNATNATIKLAPFEALYGYSPDFHIRLEDESTPEGVPAASSRVKKLQLLREKLAENWQRATESQAKYYNAHHKPMEFKQKDLLLLSTKNLKLKLPSRKLTPRYIGPFRVLQRVGNQAYRLALPEQYSRIHNVFHVSLLEPWRKSKSDGNTTESMPMPDLEETDEWEVEEIKEEKCIRGTNYFLLKWKDWPSEYNQWVPEEDMENAKDIMINKFRKSSKTKKTPKRH
jgi:transposase InsO family protein